MSKKEKRLSVVSCIWMVLEMVWVAWVVVLAFWGISYRFTGVHIMGKVLMGVPVILMAALVAASCVEATRRQMERYKE